jgi:uncharacterized protein YndB with AHSA1/START domain
MGYCSPYNHAPALAEVVSVIELQWETEVRATGEQVFSLLADLRHYNRWLAKSPAFKGTIEISDGPIGVGTTYVEPGPLGTRHGKVTTYLPPSRLDFDQPMTLKPAAVGVIGIEVFHTLSSGADSVRVVRRLRLSPRGPVRFLMPLVLRSFKTENERMMKRLKVFAESEAGTEAAAEHR